MAFWCLEDSWVPSHPSASFSALLVHQQPLTVRPPTVNFLFLVAKPQGQAGHPLRMLALFSVHSSTDETPAKCPRAPSESPDNVLPMFMVRPWPAHAAQDSTYLSFDLCGAQLSRWPAVP